MKAARPLARVLLRKIAAWYLIFAVGVTGVQLYFEYRNIRQDIIQSLDLLARTFAPGAAAALWDYQEELLKSLAHGIGEHALVATVSIGDVHGRISAAYRASETETASSDLMAQQILYHRFEDGQQEPLGALSIASSEAKALDRLKGIAWSVSLSIIAQLLFLGGMLAALSRMLVVKPLIRFSDQVGQLVTESQDQQIDVGQVEIAEIAILQQGFNQLLRRIAESHAVITAANADLERRVAERTRNLDERNQDLAREHALTLALVRSIPGIVCVLDSAGDILLANRTAESRLGSPGTALIGQCWTSLPTLASADPPLEKLFRWANESGSASAHSSFQNGSGSKRAYQFEALRVGSGADIRIIVVGVDITEQHEQELRLQHLAFHDRLTGLPNRALLLERLERAITAATRNGSRFALAFIDLDAFKPINDSVGHEAGDAVLREIASRLCQCVRQSDTVARHGGDEFVLLLSEGNPQGLLRIAEAVLESVAQPLFWQDAEFTVSASMGFAGFPQNGPGAKQMLDAADAAMYRAKQAGRNRADFGALLADLTGIEGYIRPR